MAPKLPPATGNQERTALNSKDATDRAAREPHSLERGLTPQEMADLLGVSESWLAKKRMSGDGPPFVKLSRMVRYFPSQAAPWLKSRRRYSTSE